MTTAEDLTAGIGVPAPTTGSLTVPWENSGALSASMWRPWLRSTALMLKAIYRQFYLHKIIKKNKTAVQEDINLRKPPSVIPL
jgi:hypothetical protein